MPTVRVVKDRLDAWFPPSLAESWDNTGLLLGDPEAPVERIMTCLTVTPATAREAIAQRVSLIVSHHPIWFRGTKRVVAGGIDGFLYELARAGIAVYSPHTAYDGAMNGINEQIAERLGMAPTIPLADMAASANVKPIGRVGRLEPPMRLRELAERVRTAVAAPIVQYVGQAEAMCERVAIVCGSGGEFLSLAQEQGCDTLLTGETRFHAALEAESRGMNLILAGHYATERFALETLAERLSQAFPLLTVWASRDERDPLQCIGSTG